MREITTEERQEMEGKLIRAYTRMLYGLNDYEIQVLDNSGYFTLDEVEHVTRGIQ
jgi:hypothetical protein